MERHDHNLVELWPSLRWLSGLRAFPGHMQDAMGFYVGLIRPGGLKDEHEFLPSALYQRFLKHLTVAACSS